MDTLSLNLSGRNPHGYAERQVELGGQGKVSSWMSPEGRVGPRPASGLCSWRLDHEGSPAKRPKRSSQGGSVIILNFSFLVSLGISG